MLKLVKGSSNAFSDVFAIDENGCFRGQLINSIEGGCSSNPDNSGGPGFFARVFDGHGAVLHLLPHKSPCGVMNWSEVFVNPELIPAGTLNLFLDCGDYSAGLFEGAKN